ncbi:DUF882 domain-containing protein [Pseudorhodoplanes sp.]|uniref:DUF882 domain-containing protein n=1 Tax=Pseudorhodoplanes sp. TaxID=1934341 RepID=UPI002BE2E274|nr:DUF882 domain-containing protein [Pseudorhodoplanes sp.]HWV51971.1 DUF882 domain-containing protein [Pseudorhodoplanes sp.]
MAGSLGTHTALAQGEIRSISLYHTHRGDEITVTFKRNGRYDEDGLKKLNHFLRDWRTDDVTTMDPQLFDAVWEVQREFGIDKKIHIVSSYRSPRTNEMLRKRSSGVARHSLHMQGKAMDFFIPGVPLEKVREAGLRLQRGGVGFYPTSGSPFVHMDVGNVRHWPRMTREQLARVFPDGRTVHLPLDGKPLAGFAIAQADLAKRGSSSTFETARVAAANPLARLFGLKQKPAADEDEAEIAKPAATPTQVASAGFPAPVAPRSRENLFSGMQSQTPAEAAPLPRSRPGSAPAAPAQTAAAESSAPRPPAPIAGSFALAAVTPNDIILSRGYWSGRPDPSEQSTGSIGPFVAPPGYGEGKPGDALLSYARDIEPEAAPQRARPATQAARSAALAPNTTIASKGQPDIPTVVSSAPALSERLAATERRFEGPWMRALIMTPSVERFMNTTLYGATDFRSLQPMLRKPTTMVVMTFALEPQPSLTYGRFEGRAIEFLATATFMPRTAQLR